MRIPNWFIGEFAGTFLLVFFGCGSICTAITTGAQVGIFQVAIVWGMGLATAIYLASALSGAHLNPAVTAGLAVWAGFPKGRALKYVAAQMLGAFVAAAVLYFLYGNAIASFEKLSRIYRGAPGSEASAMMFTGFFPNPGGRPLLLETRALMSPSAAFGVELIGAAILVLVIMGSTDEQNQGRPQILTAATIGLTYTSLISLFAPLTLACFNPARDLAPRIFTALAGWGAVPFRVNGLGWLTVYIVAPVIGGILGGGIYQLFFRPAYANRQNRR